jgi:GNAT superfamily N-acetyltransferase
MRIRAARPKDGRDVRALFASSYETLATSYKSVRKYVARALATDLAQIGSAATPATLSSPSVSETSTATIPTITPTQPMPSSFFVVTVDGAGDELLVADDARDDDDPVVRDDFAATVVDATTTATNNENIDEKSEERVPQSEWRRRRRGNKKKQTRRAYDGDVCAMVNVVPFAGDVDDVEDDDQHNEGNVRRCCAELQRVCVRKASQRRGLGAAMIAYALRWALQQGYTDVVVTTIDPLGVAVRLYERLAFTVVKRQQLGPELASLMMHRRIDNDDDDDVGGVSTTVAETSAPTIILETAVACDRTTSVTPSRVVVTE